MKKGSAISSAINTVISLYHERIDNGAFIVPVVDMLSYAELQTMKQRKVVIDMEPVFFDYIPVYSVGPKFVRGRRVDGNRFGVYILTFNEGSKAVFLLKTDYRGCVQSYLAANDSTLKLIYKKVKEVRRRNAKPKPGIFQIKCDQFGLKYQKMKSVRKSKLVGIGKDLDNLIEDYLRYTKRVANPDKETVLIYGSQGTGKTCLIVNTAIRMFEEHNMCCVFTSDISALMQHVVTCTKTNTPTFAVLEDAEGALSSNNSDIKNILSGIGTMEKNKVPVFIVFTSNYPADIEETIKERPERIDNFIKIDALSGDGLKELFQLYFKRVFDDFDYSIPLTGAEVKYLAKESERYSLRHDVPIDGKLVKTVLEKRKGMLKDISTFTLQSSRRPKVGFLNSKTTKI